MVQVMVDGAAVDAPTDERPPMVAALSPSSISTWKQCPKRFFYEKILRLPTEPGLEAVCGSFVHEVLQSLMDLPPAERTTERARSLATEHWATFTAKEETQFAELDLDEEQTKDFKRRAWTGISGYFCLEDPARIDVVATEQEVEADFDGAPMYGIVDRLERWGEQLVVSDYKTGKAPKWQDEIDEKLEQLRYSAAVLDALGQPVSTLRLLFVSPQLGAAAKAERCKAAAAEAMATLAEVLADDPLLVVARVEDAHRQAREACGPDDDRAAAGSAAAIEAAWAAASELVEADEAEELAQVILDTVAARKKDFFARRDAEASRPKEFWVDVTPEQIEASRAEVGRIWAEASACYEAWDFAAHTGTLCDWCPFASICESYAAWVDAGRPAADQPAA